MLSAFRSKRTMIRHLCRSAVILLAILGLCSMVLGNAPGAANTPSRDTRMLPRPHEVFDGKISSNDFSAISRSGSPTAEQGLTPRDDGPGSGRGGAYDHCDHGVSTVGAGEVSTSGVDNPPEVSISEADDMSVVSINAVDDLSEVSTSGVEDMSVLSINGVDDLSVVSTSGVKDMSVVSTSGADNMSVVSASGVDDLFEVSASGVKDMSVVSTSGVKDMSVVSTSGVKDMSVVSASGVKDMSEVSTSGVKDMSVISASGVKDISVVSASGVKDMSEVSTSGVKDMSEVSTSGAEDMSLREKGAADRPKRSNHEAHYLTPRQTKTPSVAPADRRPVIAESAGRYTKVTPDCTLTYSTSPDSESTAAECTRSAFLEAYTRTDDLSPFRSSVTLRSSDFELCSFKTARPLHAQKVLDGNITFRWEEVFNHTMPKISSKAACLQLLVPKSMVLAFQRKDIRDRSQNLYLAKVYDEDKMMWIQLNDFARGIRVYSIRNRVTVLIRGLKEKFQASEEENLLSFTLSFQAVPACASLQLEVKCPTDHATGWVQTPGWDGDREYQALMDSCVTLTVPPNHVIMTSFVDIDLDRCDGQGQSQGHGRACPCDVIELYLSPSCTGTPESSFCQLSDMPLPRVLHTPGALSIRFLADYNDQRTGFRFLYSFHPSSEHPMQMARPGPGLGPGPGPGPGPNGALWNCSGSAAAVHVLKQHFICSPDQFCAGMDEDKLSGRCSLGDLCGAMNVFHFDDVCYVYGDLRVQSWEQAEDMCQNHGGHLASLNSPRKWRQLLGWRKSFSGKFLDYVFVGLRLAEPSLPDMYRSMWQWTDSTISTYGDIRFPAEVSTPYCAAFQTTDDHLTVVQCEQKLRARYLCQVRSGPEPKPGDVDADTGLQSSQDAAAPTFPTPSRKAAEEDDDGGMVVCPRGHATHLFLACDLKSDCYADSSRAIDACVQRVSPPIPMITCKSGGEKVPYSMVCDHRPDCWDRSDEDFCVFMPCGYGQFTCGDNKQCIPRTSRCDGIKQCVDGSDEWNCWQNLQQDDIKSNTRLPPAVINFTPAGSLAVTPLNASCPETHFRCADDGYCLPVYVRCNGVYDCPGREDEAACEAFSCPGFYRCRDSRVCVHRHHLCDGVFHCPRHDDELQCNMPCAQNCTCYFHAFVCSGQFLARDYRHLRYLDASGTGMSLADLSENKLLVYVSLRNCGITGIGELDFPNLQSLDLSGNSLTSFPGQKLSKLSNLRWLSLAFNSLWSLHSAVDHKNIMFAKLTALDVSGTHIDELNGTSLSAFPTVQLLNLSGSGLQKVSGPGFGALNQLRVLDLRKCPMDVFYPNLFGDLTELSAIYADNYKLCCSAVLPDKFDPDNCHAPFDEVSSCAALLREEVFRIFLTFYALLALLGNLASFVYRVFLKGVANRLGFDAFVTHLCVSDFLMGVYLAIIGVADRMYYGSYEWNDSAWKDSVVCKVAGFLSLLSSEVSAFLICFITVERWLVICFPYRNLRFSGRSAHVASVMVWVVGVALASVPLSPLAAQWKFYGETGMCIPLPVTRKAFPGKDYVFGVMIVLNFVLFLLIASCQLLIFRSIRSSRKAVAIPSNKSKEAAIARRLLAVVLTDFLCWFPIGVLGLAARFGVPIPGGVNVAMAIFVLPFNSALNPFLYTFHMLRERWRERQGGSRGSQPKRNETSGGQTSTVRSSPSRSCSTGTQTDLIDQSLLYTGES